ncbi:MAG: acetyl-CoA carboxylase biotin carboxylase subunit [Vicinamibacterales bacterium]
MKRVLVANRGEIAVRVIRACREADIGTVAVYSDADAGALHVRLADHAERIGPAPAAESYLNIPALIEAARASGADAVHPGYGFLSERAAFARACDVAGITFIGPPAATIERMGSKTVARRVMQEAGVPVVPGLTPDDQSDAGITAAARAVGYPVLVKASAGGGGKGMRIVRADADAVPSIGAARREAVAAFGDGELYVERLIERPRHVEIQVFGDSYGSIVHLFERECSLQRRHQKVIEESPSPALTTAVRARMGQAAVAAAAAVGYTNAGTIEFLLEGEGDHAQFYFLEMNTRLQVEHPVTEAVTGVDLVRAQLLVAGGAPLPWSQSDLVQRGHAVECRVYAEDPASEFLPQAGTLALYREPVGPGIRVDSGVVDGDTIGVNYDPLVAKVVAYAETRAQAIERASGALRSFPILGIRTNVSFLLALLRDPHVRSGATHTGYIDEALAHLTVAGDPPIEAIAAAARAGATPAVAARAALDAPDPWSTLRDWGR